MNLGYREAIQDLADNLLKAVPESWQQATVEATFDGPYVSLSVAYIEAHALRAAASPPQRRIPVALSDDDHDGIAEASLNIQARIQSAGNPECHRFLFTVKRDGENSLDVTY